MSASEEAAAAFVELQICGKWYKWSIGQLVSTSGTLRDEKHDAVIWMVECLQVIFHILVVSMRSTKIGSAKSESS